MWFVEVMNTKWSLCIHKCELGVFWSPAFLCAPSSCSSGRQWLAPVLLEGFGLKPGEQNQRIPFPETIRPHMPYLSLLPSWVLRISVWLQQPIGRPQHWVSSLRFLHVWPWWEINKNWGNPNKLWVLRFVYYLIHQHWTLLSQIFFSTFRINCERPWCLIGKYCNKTR